MKEQKIKFYLSLHGGMSSNFSAWINDKVQPEKNVTFVDRYFVYMWVFDESVLRVDQVYSSLW